MKLNTCNIIFCFSLFMVMLELASASTFISDTVFESHASSGRNLLQAKRPCTVNFEFSNYTVITSKCKGPKFPPEQCCAAFKVFACPYVDQINDVTTDCSSTMFSYINLYGKYPAGLFASECREGKLGLLCLVDGPSESANDSNSQLPNNPSPLITAAAAFLVLVMMLL